MSPSFTFTTGPTSRLYMYICIYNRQVRPIVKRNLVFNGNSLKMAKKGLTSQEKPDPPPRHQGPGKNPEIRERRFWSHTKKRAPRGPSVEPQQTAGGGGVPPPRLVSFFEPGELVGYIYVYIYIYIYNGMQHPVIFAALHPPVQGGRII